MEARGMGRPYWNAPGCRCDHSDRQPCAAHSIWELILHIAVWDNSGLVRLAGKKYLADWHR